MPSDHALQPAPKRIPWNKGKLTGPKPPLRTKNVWSIRTRLQMEGRVRDLAMFNFAIDSKPRACDVVEPSPASGRPVAERELAPTRGRPDRNGILKGQIYLRGAIKPAAPKPRSLLRQPAKVICET